MCCTLTCFGLHEVIQSLQTNNMQKSYKEQNSSNFCSVPANYEKYHKKIMYKETKFGVSSVEN